MASICQPRYEMAMNQQLSVTIERFPVAGVFNIARGAKHHVDVVVAMLDTGNANGRGEATAIYYHGETAQSVAAQLEAVAPAVARGVQRGDLAGLLPRGAARNALDAAFLDLEAKQAGVPAWQILGLDRPQPLVTAYTISLAPAAEMEAAARATAGDYPLLKLKLAGDGDLERVAAVRRGAPMARLIVDANESWHGRDIAAEAAALAVHGVELIEQPVPAGQDHLLDGVESPIPLCADESCQDRADLPRLAARYQAINIKLDKCGGLTEGLALAREAQALGLDLMTGCMLSTSLGIAPAYLLAGISRWVDLDGPLLLAQDRSPPISHEGGILHPPSQLLWG